MNQWDITSKMLEAKIPETPRKWPHGHMLLRDICHYDYHLNDPIFFFFFFIFSPEIILISFKVLKAINFKHQVIVLIYLLHSVRPPLCFFVFTDQYQITVAMSTVTAVSDFLKQNTVSLQLLSDEG